MARSDRHKAGMPGKTRIIDRHLLYEAAVQSVDADLDLFARIYRRRRGKRPLLLREDFCGTAALACEWVRRREDHQAWGVDFHRPTLEWGRKTHRDPLGPAARRVHLLCRDVRSIRRPPVDMVAALNFSYSTFKERAELRRYFRTVHASLRKGGIFFVDAFGGTETMSEMTERRRIPAEAGPGGVRIPRFTYIWEQKRFNPINHHILCHIHFRLPGGIKMERAFTYDWRLWTLPELQEIMIEAGFASTEVYLEGWDDEDDESDGVFRQRKTYENQEGWVGYVVGLL